MDFDEAERRYYELKGRLDAGKITPQEYQARLRDLRATDASGGRWMIGGQTGRWYFFDGKSWVQGEPPRPAPAPGATRAQGDLCARCGQPVRPGDTFCEACGRAVGAASAEPPAPPPLASRLPTPGATESRGARPAWLAVGLLAIGFLLVCGILAAAAVLLPQSPLRGLIGGFALPLTATIPAASPTASVPATETPTPTAAATSTPAPLPTATPFPATQTPTRTPAQPTPTFTALPATATPTSAPPTVTAVPAPSSTPTATATPNLQVTLSNPHYERWGKPTNPDGCNDYTNATPVRKFTMQLVVTNNTNQTVAGDWGPSYVSNTGATLARCYYDYQGSATIPPGQTRNVTFSTYTNTDGNDWVSRVNFSALGGAWTWTLDRDGRIIAGP